MNAFRLSEAIFSELRDEIKEEFGAADAAATVRLSPHGSLRAAAHRLVEPSEPASAIGATPSASAERTGDCMVPEALRGSKSRSAGVRG